MVDLKWIFSTLRFKPSIYLDRSEEIEGSSDFVAAGERRESKAVSEINTLGFNHQKGVSSLISILDLKP